MRDCFSTGGLQAHRRQVEKDFAPGVEKGRDRGRFVMAKVPFTTRGGSTIPVGTWGRYVEHHTDGDATVVWVLFSGRGLASARGGSVESVVE